MPDGGTITIATRNCDVDANFAAAHPGLAPGPHVCLSVSDTGTGMKPETQARIFDPFFTTKPLGQGTGLGLSTVFGILRQSGGAISVDSSWGQGSRLSAFLPAYTSRQAPRPAPARPPRGSAAQTRGKGETILVVEDEEGPRRLVLDVLRSQGYNVLEAHHPEAALHLSEQYAGDIQLLVTDIVMPAMNGCLLASKLADQRPDLRVLLISGYADEVTSSFPFLQKPFAPHELARTVHSLLE
jgi:CheY-like chemotaxis protein